MRYHEAQVACDKLINEIYIIRNPDCVPPRDRKPLRDIATVRAEFIIARAALDRIRAEEDARRVKELERLDRVRHLSRL